MPTHGLSSISCIPHLKQFHLYNKKTLIKFDDHDTSILTVQILSSSFSPLSFPPPSCKWCKCKFHYPWRRGRPPIVHHPRRQETGHRKLGPRVAWVISTIHVHECPLVVFLRPLLQRLCCSSYRGRIRVDERKIGVLACSPWQASQGPHHSHP